MITPRDTCRRCGGGWSLPSNVLTCLPAGRSRDGLPLDRLHGFGCGVIAQNIVGLFSAIPYEAKKDLLNGLKML